MSEGISDFIAAMSAAGVVPAEPIAGKLAGGRLVRFRCEGDGKKRNGWAVFLPVVPGQRTRARGQFGNYKQSTGTIEWWAERDGPALSPAERAQLRAQAEADAERRARETEEQYASARAEANRIWESAERDCAAHPYAERKRMRVGGLRQSGDALLVPMRDASGALWNLQRIYPDGAKRFLKGGRITGLCAMIGMHSEFTRGVFAEGYATGEAISQALRNCPVIVALNTANLEPVVSEWVRRYPRADWVIAADDDHQTGLKMVERGEPYANPGIDKAREVAAAHGCRVAYPPNLDGPRGNIDFSDVLLAHGSEPVREAFAEARRRSTQLSLAERIGMGAADRAQGEAA